jgi:hypothetical protein
MCPHRAQFGDWAILNMYANFLLNKHPVLYFIAVTLALRLTFLVSTK